MNKNEKIETAKALALMFSAFPQSATVDVDLQMEAYMFVLGDRQFDDVIEAIKRVMSGGEGHEHRAFVPSTAELCSEVEKRGQMRAIRDKRGLRLVSDETRFDAARNAKKSVTVKE